MIMNDEELDILIRDYGQPMHRGFSKAIGIDDNQLGGIGLSLPEYVEMTFLNLSLDEWIFRVTVSLNYNLSTKAQTMFMDVSLGLKDKEEIESLVSIFKNKAPHILLQPSVYKVKERYYLRFSSQINNVEKEDLERNVYNVFYQLTSGEMDKYNEPLFQLIEKKGIRKYERKSRKLD